MWNEWWNQMQRGTGNAGKRAFPVIGPGKAQIIGPQADFIMIRPSTPHDPLAIEVGPTEAEVVSPPPRGVWAERGWEMQSRSNSIFYRGTYQAANRRTSYLHSFPGRIEVSPREVRAYIADPPPGLSRHPKACCFTLESLPWFRIHWWKPAMNVDDAILYIEKVLVECLN